VTEIVEPLGSRISLPSTMLQTGVPLLKATVSVRFVLTLELVCSRNFQSQELEEAPLGGSLNPFAT